ncbi:MAG: THUMP domain-containing protein [Acidilobaceae archaeon]
MRELVIVRYGEIGVKGPATRRLMERLLVSALKEALERHGVRGVVERSEARVYIWDPSDVQRALYASSRVFGVKSVSPAHHITFSDLNDLVSKARDHFAERVKGKKFKVEARRVGSHDFTSMDVERALGATLLEAGASRVDLKSPEYVAYVEIRGRNAFFTIES